MKKHLHKILAGLLLATSIVSMTGCDSKEKVSGDSQVETNKDVAMGRYIEEDLEVPQDIKNVTDFIIHEDGVIDVYGMDDKNLIIYTRQTTGTWTKVNAEWVVGFNEKGNRLNKVAYGQDGRTYVLYIDSAYESHIAEVIPEGTLREIAIEWGEQQGYAVDIEVLADGDILVGRQNMGITRFDANTGKVKEQYDGLLGEISVVTNKMVMVDIEQQQLVVYALETGEEIQTIPYEGLDWDSRVIIEENGGLYLINQKGINHLVPDGSVWETVLEGNLSSLGMPSMYMREIKLTNQDEFVVAFGSMNEGNQLVKYSYQADVPTRPTTQVNVYMLEENMTVRQAAAEYQRNNPGVFVNLQIGMSEGDGVTKSDAIRSLNTELLAGKGPDILILDGLPIDSYIAKGVLQDMSDWAKPAIEAGEWLENIATAYEKDGAIYALPTRFTLPVMWGNKDIIESVRTVEELATWADEHSDKQVFLDMTPQDLIKRTYGTSAGAWIDDKGQIKQEEFAQFLEAINVLADVDAEEELPEQAGLIESRSAEYLAYKDIELHLQEARGFMNIMLSYSAMLQSGNGSFGLSIGGVEGIFEPVGIVGINANSKHQDIVRDIITTALSSKVQDVDLGDGFAVNTEAFDKQADLSDMQGTVMSIAMSAPGARQVEMKMPEQDTYTKLAELAKSVSVPAMKDEVLLQMIIDETKGYFDGEKTAEEAAAAVSQRTKAYLAE
ncbi:MAG: ABC transporter substrate-binding protein [Cellulosilyticaceae bacterium]